MTDWWAVALILWYGRTAGPVTGQTRTGPLEVDQEKGIVREKE